MPQIFGPKAERAAQPQSSKSFTARHSLRRTSGGKAVEPTFCAKPTLFADGQFAFKTKHKAQSTKYKDPSGLEKRNASRHPVRLQNVAEETGLHPCGGAHARSGYRRERRDFFRRERRLAQPAAVSKSGAVGYVPSKQTQLRHRRHSLSQLRRSAAREPDVHVDVGLAWCGLYVNRRGRRRASNSAHGDRRLLQRLRHSTHVRPQL